MAAADGRRFAPTVPPATRTELVLDLRRSDNRCLRRLGRIAAGTDSHGETHLDGTARRARRRKMGGVEFAYLCRGCSYGRAGTRTSIIPSEPRKISLINTRLQPG